jgi:hypothetical protein
VKPSPYFWLGLLAFLIIAIGLWLGFVQVTAEWLWNLFHAF